MLVVADPALLHERALQLGLTIDIHQLEDADAPLLPGALNVMPVAAAVPVEPGAPDPANAAYVIKTLDTAVTLVERGNCAALVTGPVNKAVINNGGLPFSGHTEWLEHRTGAKRVVMLLATDGLMVALATTHLPLRDVPDAITADRLAEVVTVLDADLRHRFRIPRPRILVLGLNPHAGERGHLGQEEIDVISPALEALRADGISLTGPVPADTAFSPALLDAHDAVLAMYHDQGLPVLKFKGFGAAANITLGLPIIRTSVDHGTAESLAGTGQADAGGFITAVRYAKTMVGAQC